MTNPGDLAQQLARYCVPQLEDALKEVGAPWMSVPLLLSIGWRESRFDETKLYRDYGTPLNPFDDRGDQGHGHGFFQIDDRYHTEFVKKGGAYFPYMATHYFITEILIPYKAHIKKNAHFELLEPWLSYAAVAAYNCGAGGVCRALQRTNRLQFEGMSPRAKHEIIDFRTAIPARNYSWDVVQVWQPWWINWYGDHKARVVGEYTKLV